MEADHAQKQRIGKRVSGRRFFSTMLALGTLAACSKAPDNATAGTPAPPATAATAAAAHPAPAEPTPPTPVPETAAPPPSTSAHTEVAATKPKAAKPTAAGTATHAAAPAPAEGPKTFDCGEKGQPVCPLQGFMKSQVAPAVANGDNALLAKALDQVAGHAPPGLTSWSAIAKGGAAKARAGDIVGAKDSCKACHDQYKTRYKTEMRDRAW
jgi:hypothetical protein